jgi:hypothetical protein
MGDNNPVPRCGIGLFRPFFSHGNIALFGALFKAHPQRGAFCPNGFFYLF